MSVSVGKIVTQVNSRIVSGGQDVIDTARLAGSVEALESRYSVANLAALPPAADNTGRFIYVEDIAVYRYSDGTQWTNDYDTTANVTNGQLWSWGNTPDGQVGDGTTVRKCSPVREFCSATDWCQVSAGYCRTGAIKTSGQIWVWGSNAYGRLGDGTAVNRCSPVREFCSATDWCGISVGNFHTAAIKTSGQIWTWGSNNQFGFFTFFPLGDGTSVNRCSPVREISSSTDWCQVSAGATHTAAIKTSGQLWLWGGNTYGSLGDGTLTNRCSPVREFCSSTDWCQVSGGRFNSVAIKTTGQLWAWGYNQCGRLGDGTTVDKCSPVREFCSATNWCHASSYDTLAAIKTSGELWTWGVGFDGRLGDGTTVSKCSPVREFCSATDWCGVNGRYHTTAIKTSGQLWAWGRNIEGQLGNGTTLNHCSPVRERCSATDWCQVSAGHLNTAAVKITKGFNEP